MKHERPLLPYVKILAALSGEPLDEGFLEHVQAGGEKMRKVSGVTIVLALLCCALYGAGGGLARAGPLMPTSIVIQAFLLVLAVALICLGVANYNWIASWHSSIAEALAQEEEIEKRVIGGA